MKNELNRVWFFSVNDMASGMMLDKAETILKGFDESTQYVDINDVIKLYHIRLYIDGGLFLNRWTEVEKSVFKVTVGKYWGVICRFFNEINDSNFQDYYSDLDQGYVHSFWELMSKCKTHERISENVFNNILEDKNIWIEPVLEQETIVKHFSRILRDHFLRYSRSAEVILSKYEVNKDYNNKTVHLPPSLSSQDKVAIFDKYLDWEDANMNYVKLIVTARNLSDFNIPDTLRLKAQKCHETFMSTLLNSDSAMKFGYSVAISEIQKEPKIVNYENGVLNISYSLPWIQHNSDIPSLFKNFVYLLEFLDAHNRISLVSLKAQAGLVDLFGIRAANYYSANMQFESKNNLAFVQIIAYEHILEKLGLSLDRVLQDAFNGFTSAQKIDNLCVSFPSSASSILEKIRFILPEMETLLKKYKLYVEHGNIDPDLLAISSTPCRIQDIPSKIEKKYVYGLENKIGRIQYLFFSDQPILNYVNPFKGKYKSLFDLLWNEKVAWNNLEEYQRVDYQWLIDQGYLAIEGGYVQIKNDKEILVFRELYENEVISYWHYTEDSRAVFDKLCEQGYIEFGCSLLSKPEIDYFNYYLNKSEFTNGADLRNKYAHGSHHYGEETMKSDYYKLLILLVLLEWKIVDDIILTESNKLSKIN